MVFVEGGSGRGVSGGRRKTAASAHRFFIAIVFIFLLRGRPDALAALTARSALSPAEAFRGVP